MPFPRRSAKQSRQPGDARLDALIERARARRTRERAALVERRRVLAHTAREIAEHLKSVAVSLDHDPLEDDEVTAYAKVLRRIDRLTPGRRPLATTVKRMADEPFTSDDLRAGWVNPLGNLWAVWTQVFNRTEFAQDRDAMSAPVPLRSRRACVARSARR